MSQQKVLFIGGSGAISSACSQLAVERGFDLYVLNRGRSLLRPLPDEVTMLRGDIRDPESAAAALGSTGVRRRRRLGGVHAGANPGRHRPFPRADGAVRVHQLRVGIPEATGTLPVLESTPLRNPFWPYSRDKIACEEMLDRPPTGPTGSRRRSCGRPHLRPDVGAVRRWLDRTSGSGGESRSWSTVTARRCGR